MNVNEPLKPGETRVSLNWASDKWVVSRRVGRTTIYNCRPLSCEYPVVVMRSMATISRDANPKALARFAENEAALDGKVTIVSGPISRKVDGFPATFYSLRVTGSGAAKHVERVVIAAGNSGISLGAASINAGEAKRALQEFLSKLTIEDGGPRAASN